MSATQHLETYPRLNPVFFKIPELFGWVLPTVTSTDVTVNPFIWILLVIFIIFFMKYTLKVYWTLETPANIRCKLSGFLERFNKYGDGRTGRMGLRAYINGLKTNGVPDSHLAITNFMVSSSNTPAFFTPIRDGIASPDAIRLTLAAGARYLDFSIWGDGRQHNYRPMIKGMDVGSQWRRITMNEIPFKTAMESVRKYAFSGVYADTDTNSAPYNEDPLFIMLRFKGKMRNQTFNQVADILRDTIEQNRLDFTYNKGRNMEGIFKVPITQLYSKVIIMSNVYPVNSVTLIDYINIGPRSTLAMELSSKEILAIPDTDKGKYIGRIQQNMTISRTELDEPDCNTNTNDWSLAHSIGIHFAAQNFWSEDESLAKYFAPDTFGKSSFKIKEIPLRYVIEYVKPPLLPNPELNARDGKPNAPPNLRLPGQ